MKGFIQTFNQTLQQKEANKGSKRPIEDLFSDHEFSSNQKKRHKRSDPQPGTSRQVDRYSQFVDHEKGEIDKRLEEFVKVCVNRFEKKLDEYKKEAAVDGAPKTGKIGEKLVGPLGAVQGAAAGLASGVSGAAGGGATLGGKASSVWNFFSGRSHRKKAKRVTEVFRHIEKDERRRMLVKAGGDIFQSFESQFIRVTDADGSWARAIEKLAVDAMDRAISYIDDYKEKNPDMNIEAFLDLITKGVILGKSKKGIGASVVHFIKADKLAKVPIIPESIKSRISRPGHTVKNEGEEWKIADLYKGVGIVTINDNGNSNKYYKKRYTDDADKYGYRILFKWESWESEGKFYREYTKPLEKYKYTLKSEKLEQKLETILDKINKNDPGKISEKVHEIHKVLVIAQQNNKQIKEPVWFDVKEPVKSFTGRDGELKDLDNALQSKGRQVVISQMASISGLGGIGKSELARKYAYEHRKDYGGNAVWINAETQESLKKSFQELAKELKIPIKEKKRERTESFTTIRDGNLHYALQDRQAEASQKVSIESLGNVRKLARQYSYESRPDYGSDAEMQEGIENLSQELAKKLRTHTHMQGIKIDKERGKDDREQERNIKLIVRDVYKYFENKKSLFIFDDAEEYKTINEFLPQSAFLSPDSKKPSVLITSRIKEWDAEDEGEIKVLELCVFTKAEAEGFIKESLNIKDDLQKEEIQQLAEKAQYFPLALRQAVAYIHYQNKKTKLRGSKKFKISDYLREYEQQKNKLFSFEGYKHSDRYTQTVLTTWVITLKKIKSDREHGKQAIDILNIMAYFAHNKVNVKDLLSGLKDEEKMWNAIELLNKYSMINLEDGVSNIHKLVQQVIRLELKEQEKEEEVLRKSLELISSAVDIAEENTSHVMSVWNYASKYDKLINDFCFDSTYGKEKNTPLHLLAKSGDKKTIESILTHIEKNHPNKLSKIINITNKNGRTPLHMAAYYGNLDVVKYLIDEKKADFTVIDKYGRTLLHRAAYNGHLDTVKYLVDKGINVSVADKDGDTPLHDAAESGKLDVVKYFVEEKGADVNAKNKDDMTPLHMAAKSGSLDVVKYFVEEKGADVNANAKGLLYSGTPLHMAAKSGKLDIVKYFVEEKGADVNAKDKDDRTPLHMAAESGKLDVVKYFVEEKGADANAKGLLYSGTPLHMAAKNGKLDIVKYFVEEKGADVNAKDKDDMTPLYMAAYNGHLNTVKYLIDKGVDVNVADKDGDTPLHYAAYNGHLDTVKYFIDDKKADFKVQNKNGRTLLHKAALSGNLDVVKYFVEEKGADVNAKDKDGRTPLHMAAYNGHLNTVKYLVEEKKADFTVIDKYGRAPLHRAAYNGHLDIVKYLIDKGIDVNVADKDGDTPLHDAAESGHLDTVKYFIDDKKADFKVQNKNGRALLHKAALSGNLDVVKYFVEEKGADVSAKDKDDMTPLHMAAYNGHLNTVKYLIEEKKADFTVIDKYGRTPLHRSAYNGHLDIVKYLIDKGIDVNVADKDGDTPLHDAAESGHLDTVKYFIDDKKADFNVVDNYGYTPLHYAAQGGHLDTVKYLIDEKNADFEAVNNWGSTPLHLAALYGHKEVASTLLDKVKDDSQELNKLLFDTEESEITPLHYAALNGHKEVIDILLNIMKSNPDDLKDLIFGQSVREADFNDHSLIVKLLLEKAAEIFIKNKRSTIIHEAVRGNKEEIIKLILDKIKEKNENIEQHINEPDNKGDTPLMWAAEAGKIGAAQILLEYGANINAEDEEGITALHFATKGGYQEIVKLLLDKQADPNVKDKNGKTPLDLARDQSNQKIIDLLKPSVQQKEIDLIHQEGVSSSIPLEECLLGPSSSSRGSSTDRKKRSAEAEGCEFSWEDVNKFNEKKEETRDFSKIKISSDRFIDYIKNTPMSEAKLAQLVQLANKVKVTGKFQGLVNNLISNQKIMNHLNRVRRVSGIAMHGMMGKAAMADFLNGDYTGVAINVGFFAGGQGFARVAQAASIKGTGLVLDGKLLLGRSLKAASPFLARGTSAFVVYDLVNQVKAFKNGTEEAIVSVVGDSIYLGVDAAEVGIEIAEAFEVFEGVSSITGPIGAAIGAIIFVGTDIYLAVKRVDKINEIIHLTGKERFFEGLRAFIGVQPEQYIEELMEEKEVSNQLVKQGLEYLQQHSDIQRYAFPTGKSVIDSCRDVPYKANVCASGGLGGGCSKTRTVTRYAEECTTKFQVDLDNKVLLNRKRTDIKWSRTKPDNLRELLCLPQGDYEQVSSSGAYLCNNAIGIESSTNKTGNYTFINLGEGNDDARGFIGSPNIFSVSNGFKRLYGGNKDDLFVLQGDIITGHIDGGHGTNTIDLSEFASKEKSMLVNLNREYIEHQGYGNNSFGVIQINKLLARKDKKDVIDCSCNTKYVDGQGGESSEKDIITVPSSIHCFYKMQLVVKPNTSIYNHAVMGNFSYIIPAGSGKADVNLETSESRHDLFFNYTLLNARAINVNSIGYNITFSFSSTSEENAYDRFFNVTISPNANNTFYKLNDNTEIKVGKKNLYAVQGSNKPVDEIVNSYPAIADRLKMSLFVQSLNETVAIGHGNHDVLRNDPYYKSHLIGNGGENIFVVTSGYETLDDGKLPIPEVVIYDVDKENLIDTLDLRQIRKQVRKDLGKKIKTRISMSGRDLLIELFYPNSTKSLVTVRLKDALVTNWHERLQVILNNSSMKIEEFDLKPLPLVFSEDKEIIVITPKDIEEESKLVISKKAGDYVFARSGNDLIITNAFDRNLTNNELCTISLSKFYQKARMQTLSIKFADKEISLKDEIDRINNASTLTEQLVRYKNDTYHTIFNYSTTASNITDLHRRKRRDESEVKGYEDSNLLFYAQDNATFTIKNDQVTSGANKLSSWINTAFGFATKGITKLESFFPTINAEHPTITMSLHQGNTQSSLEPQHIDVDGTILLLDVLIRKITGEKYVSSVDQSVSLLETQASALSITEEFEEILNSVSDEPAIDFAEVESKIFKAMMSGDGGRIPKILYSSVEEAKLEPEVTKKIAALEGFSLANVSPSEGQTKHLPSLPNTTYNKPQTCLSNIKVENSSVQLCRAV